MKEKICLKFIYLTKFGQEKEKVNLWDMDQGKVWWKYKITVYARFRVTKRKPNRYNSVTKHRKFEDINKATTSNSAKIIHLFSCISMWSVGMKNSTLKHFLTVL